MKITKDTKVVDIMKEYPWLKEELIKTDAQFKKLNSPMAKIILKKATLADVSKRTGVNVETLIPKLEEFIEAHL